MKRNSARRSGPLDGAGPRLALGLTGLAFGLAAVNGALACGAPAGIVHVAAVDERLDISLDDGRVVRLAGLDGSIYRNPKTRESAGAILARFFGGDVELDVLGGVRILHSPGHTAGHLCLHLPALSLLIAGDLLRLDGGVIREAPSNFAADAGQALDSARKVVALGFERFIGYHGGFTLSGAGELLSSSLTR